jgi:squalene-associated FAD-dependent desaturase
MQNKAHVGIIGGGVAGLAAATTLAEKGIATTILEAGSQLGGRARNVAVEFNSQVVQLDNGQHILLGAYHETLKLLKQIGVDEKQAFKRLPLTLEVRSLGDLPAFKFRAPNTLPFPINQLYGFLFCKGLTLSERFKLVGFILHLKQSGFHLPEDKPLHHYLQEQQQSDHTVALLWEPLCLAALNTPLHLASSKIFLNVLRDTFNGKKSDSELLLPKQGLSELFAQPVAHYIHARKGQALTKHRVKSITPIENGFQVISNNGTFEFSHLVLATSALRLKDIAGSLPRLAGTIETTNEYEYQPIYTVYLQYPSDAKLPQPMIGLAGATSQWVFDRGALCGQYGLIAVIISAEGMHQKLTHDALSLHVANELHRAFPSLKKPLWHQVIAEKRATFSCKVNLPRPISKTREPNIYLAGDYTYPDYPATIEGAIRSGIEAANMVKVNYF